MSHKLSNMVDWLGGHVLAVLVGLIVIVAGTWLFIELSDEVLEGETQSFDERMVKAMRRADDPAVPVGPDWMAEIGRDLTAIGGVAVLVLLTLIVCGFFGLSRKYTEMWFVFVSVIGGLVLSVALKEVIHRPRPDIVPHLSHVYTSSFPSGHSMMSATVYLTLGILLARFVQQKRLKFYFVSVAMLLTCLVGLSRIYMGVHYPTDVLAGWLAGLVWAVLCWLVAGFLIPKIGSQTNIESST